MNEIGIALVWCAVQVTLIGALAAGVYLVGRRTGRSGGSLTAVTGLLVIVGLSMLALSPWPRWPVMAAPAATEALPAESPGEAVSADSQRRVLSPATEGPASDQRASGPSDLAQPGPSATAAAFWRALVDELSAVPVAAEVSQWRWSATVATVFLVVVGAGLLWVLSGLVAVQSYRRRSRPVGDAALLEQVDLLRAELGCRRRIEVRQSDELVTATTFGWRRPVILLPAEWPRWTEQERRVVLAHETAHIHHNDFLTCLVGQLGVVLHFYHPLVHWLAGRLRLEQELAADAVAASVSGGRKPYLRTLAEIALRQEDRFVVWPARTFLPTRRTFLRRIEMLRHSRASANRLPAGVRMLVAGVLVACGLAVAGLRGPQRNGAAMAADAPRDELISFVKAPALDLSQLPADALGLVSVRPAELARRAELKEIAAFVNDESKFQEDVGVRIEDIEQVTWVFLGPRESGEWGDFERAVFREVCTVIRTFDPADAKKILEAVSSSQMQTRQKLAGQTYFTDPEEEWGYFEIDRRTLVVGQVPAIKRFLTAPKGGFPKVAELPGWKQVRGDPLIVAADLAACLRQVPPSMRRSVPPPLQAFVPLWEEPAIAALGVRVDDKVRVRVAAACHSEESAKRWHQTVEAARVLGVNMIRQQREKLGEGTDRSRSADEALTAWVIEAADELLGSVDFRRQGKIVRVRTEARTESINAMVLVDAGRVARAAARRAASINNLKQIGLAMHHYHEAHGRFPAAASYDANGRPLLSWRVHLLPFLGSEELYKEFHLDEPWDSADNVKLLPKMPPYYRAPAAKKSDKHYSSYYVLTGPNTVFPGRKGMAVQEITDGTVHTILAVEADRPVPWTKPEDVPYDAGKPLPKLGGFSRGVFGAVMCDGAVHLISQAVDEGVLRALIDPRDGKLIDDDAIQFIK